MRDAATAAAMSDPERNQWFRRRWHHPHRVPSVPTAWVAEADGEPEPTAQELLALWRRERAQRGGAT